MSRVIVSAHLDDAVLSAFSALVLAAAGETYRQVQKHRGKDILSGELH